MIGPNANTAEKGPDDEFPSRQRARRRRKVVRNNTDERPQLEDIPYLAAEQAYVASIPAQRIKFASKRADQRRLPAAVRAEDCDVFPDFNAQIHVPDNNLLTAYYRRVAEFNQRRQTFIHSFP